MLVEEGFWKAWSICTPIKVKREGHPSPPLGGAAGTEWSEFPSEPLFVYRHKDLYF